MKAADVYRVLQAELEPLFRARGFRRTRAGRLTYQRRVGDRYHSVWFQSDRWGWDPVTGSSFFVSCAAASSPDPEAPDRREERLNHFLTDDELKAARALRDRIVARIPRPPASYFDEMERQFRKYPSGDAMLAALRAQLEPEPTPYRRNHDFGLRYHELGDVAEWAAFVAAVLPRAFDAMRDW